MHVCRPTDMQCTCFHCGRLAKVFTENMEDEMRVKDPFVGIHGVCADDRVHVVECSSLFNY